MTIRLPKELEQFVHNEVRNGRYAREEDVILDALTRLSQAAPEAATPVPRSRRTKTAEPRKERLTLDELHQEMLASGQITQLPDTKADFDDPDDQLIDIKGEPISETIIRERG